MSIETPLDLFRDAKLFYDQSKQLKTDQSAINNFFSKLKEFNADDITDALSQMKSGKYDPSAIFENASDSCKKFGAELESTAKTYDEAAAQSKKFIASQRDGISATNSFGKAAKGAAAVFKNFAVALGNMLVVTVIITAIEGLVKVIDSLHMSAKEAAEATQKAVSDFENQRAAIEGNVKTVESLRDRYAELSRGVNDLGENVALSADEYAEYKNIVQQIVDITPSVIQGYNDEGEAILNRNDLIQQSIDLLKQERIEKAKNAVWSKDGNDGGKSNLEASIIDFDANYRKQQFEAEKAAMEFSDFLGQVFRSTKEDDDLASFQKVIEKYAGATVDSLGTIQTVGKGGRISEHQANVYDLLTQKSDKLASRSDELIKEL